MNLINHGDHGDGNQINHGDFNGSMDPWIHKSMAMRYLPYIRPIFQAYVREYPHKIWPEEWYRTSILGS